MKFAILCVLSSVLICSEATYYGALAGKYGLGGYSYGGLGGLGYGAPVSERVSKVSKAYTLPAVAYNIVPVGNSAYNTPLDFDTYGIFYDGASGLGLVDAAYGAGAYAPLKYGYGSTLGLLGSYGYPLKK